MHSRKVIFLFFILHTFLFAQPKIGYELVTAMETATSPLEIVVTFKGNSAPTAAQMEILSNVGITNGFSFQALPIAGVLATPEQINLLADNSEIRSIFLNYKLDYHNYNSRNLTGVDRLRADANLTAENGGFPVSGKGIGILINDSGIDGTHKDLEYGRYVVQNVMGSTNPHAYDEMLPIVYLENLPSTDNNSGHGTHVAGTVGGRGVQSGGKYRGVAPGATLLGYGSGAVLFVLDALGGFDYGLTHQYEYGIRIITNSWGSTRSFEIDDPVNVATKIAYDNGITILFSAGNSGPYEATLNAYAAPWVITVAAGDRYGRLADFSSRGIKDHSYSFELNGTNWTYENKPAITGPGVGIISCRAIAPLSALSDDSEIETAYLPYYMAIDGTSMSTPHVAGIAALMLEANPSLSPMEVKNILQQTATNMPGYEDWEVGAGYVNAYAAVEYVFHQSNYGNSVNLFRDFNSNVIVDIQREPYIVDFNPVIPLSQSGNEYKFTVDENVDAIEVISFVSGIEGDEGNPIGLVLIAPDGTKYSSGVYVAFPLYQDRIVGVTDPIPGEWTAKYYGLVEEDKLLVAGLPENIEGYVKYIDFQGYIGLNDINGHPAESSIKLAVMKKLVDGLKSGNYYPNRKLKRIDLANYLMMGQAIRQYLPSDGTISFGDVSGEGLLFAESVTNRGAALRDRFHTQNGVMLDDNGNFDPNGSVARYELAYSLVQVLGLQNQAEELNGNNVTVTWNNEEIPIDDANQIPAGYEGYVQLALDLNLINAFFSLEQGPYDLIPTLHAKFKPLLSLTRADFAVIITRTHDQWNTNVLNKSGNANETSLENISYELNQNYPNPFNPTTTINFTIPKNDFVKLNVYNVLGERVVELINEVRAAGSYQVEFDARNFASGTYIYQLETSNYIETKKMSLLK